MVSLYYRLSKRLLHQGAAKDDHATDQGGEAGKLPETSVSFTIVLCKPAEMKTDVNKFSGRNCIDFKSNMETHGRYLDVRCEYELHILPHTKDSTAKDRGKNCKKIRSSLSPSFFPEMDDTVNGGLIQFQLLLVESVSF